ncbi:MAG TPA: MgtC/SapB family protein [Acidimicrobiales bacterium]|nr:MgtC/SapB family protein [Acidimicrobiales bacterium]
MALPSDTELAVRIVVAAALGAVVGLEREISDQSAGLRTHLSVALGSALFVIAGAYGFSEFYNLRPGVHVQVSVDRVASTVVTGIGFLGGGAILKHGSSVRGLTTAGSLWVTAAIGMAVAVGSYGLAVVSTVVLLAALSGLRAPRRWIDRHLVRRRRSLVVTLAPGSRAAEVITALSDIRGLDVKELSVRVREGATVVEAEVRASAGVDLETAMGTLISRDDVEAVDFGV